MASIIKVDEIKSQANGSAISIASGGAITLNQANPTLTLGANTTFPSGHILQMESASFNGVQTIGYNTVTDITNLSCSMTINSGNKVFIQANLINGFTNTAYGSFYVTDGSNNIIYKNSTATGNQINASMISTPRVLGASDQYLVNQTAFSYLWTPGVTAITVKLRGQCTYYDSNYSIYINRGHSTDNDVYVQRGTSTLTIFEVQV